MEYKVKKFNVFSNNHTLVDSNGNEFYVDIFVDGKLSNEETNETIVGKTIDVGYLHPHEYIAMDAFIVNNEAVE